MDAYYNRYQPFLINGEQTVVPFIPLQSKSSDQRYIYRTGFSRLDKVSTLQDYKNGLDNYFFYYGR